MGVVSYAPPHLRSTTLFFGGFDHHVSCFMFDALIQPGQTANSVPLWNDTTSMKVRPCNIYDLSHLRIVI